MGGGHHWAADFIREAGVRAGRRTTVHVDHAANAKEKLQVSHSKIHGLGLFAGRRLAFKAFGGRAFECVGADHVAGALS